MTLAMLASRKIPEAHPAFEDLPVVPVALDGGRTHAAVHVSGRLGPGAIPLVCVAGFERNMSDFSDLLQNLRSFDLPIVLLDLPGRGRASDRQRRSDYGTPTDAADLARVLMALGIERAVFLGQGYGGQLLMLLAAQHPMLMAGAILMDSGPLSDPRGLVRLRSNLEQLHTLKAPREITNAHRRILARDYPGLEDAELDRLALRTHYRDKRGRARPLFDHALEVFLAQFGFDDVLAAQWPLFEGLRKMPLMLGRTQLTDQLHRETFDEMLRRRPDSKTMLIQGQGSPALLGDADEARQIADFMRHAIDQRS